MSPRGLQRRDCQSRRQRPPSSPPPLLARAPSRHRNEWLHEIKLDRLTISLRDAMLAGKFDRNLNGTDSIEQVETKKV
jgi:hypothetical protein